MIDDQTKHSVWLGAISGLAQLLLVTAIGIIRCYWVFELPWERILRERAEARQVVVFEQYFDRKDRESLQTLARQAEIYAREQRSRQEEIQGQLDDLDRREASFADREERVQAERLRLEELASHRDGFLRGDLCPGRNCPKCE